VNGRVPRKLRPAALKQTSFQVSRRAYRTVSDVKPSKGEKGQKVLASTLETKTFCPL